MMVGGLQIKIQYLRCGGIAAHEVGSEQLTVAKHAERARSTGKKEDQLSQDTHPSADRRANPQNVSCPVEGARALPSELGFAG